MKDDEKKLDAELKSTYDKGKSKQLKRAGEEEFKLPKKAARTIKEIPIKQVVCTPGNKFSVLEVEEVPPGKSSHTPAVKPIMLRIVDGYNLIVQDVNRKFPGTINKMAGNYIKIQPATPDDHHDSARKYSSRALHHLTARRLAHQEKSLERRNAIIATFSITPAKTARCLKCGKNHRTGDCTIAGKIEKPRCINCNQEGHVASLSCTAFPKIKPKKGESTQNNNNKTKNTTNNIPATRPVEANVSFANVCSGKVNQQMATPGEITAPKNQEALPPKVKGLPQLMIRV
ncbi:hypothetical protein TNCV_3891251 [Trichonephila clavipes]|nr:hypothetical protein TNCV_3891251 [Trichonephila clavipes]